MIKYALLFLIIISTTSLAQINYQKGYFIDNNNEVHDCYIKDQDWLNIPKTFSYRQHPESEELSISISEVKEFKVNDNKYIRAQVDIDNSSSDFKRLSSIRKPELTREILFLKVLVEGKSSLYYFRLKGYDRYFFKKDTSSINQLIYKRYVISNTETGINSNFQNQLRAEMNCRNYGDRKFQSLKYDGKVLENFFLDYNKCMGDSTQQTAISSKSSLHFKITPGIDFASMEAQSSNRDVIAKFEPKVRLRVGIDLELVLPFNRNKWAVVSEPTFQSYKSTAKTKATRTVDYQSFELSLGLRHYFFLNQENRIFITGLAILDVPIKYEVVLPAATYTAKPISTNAAIGAGYNFKKLSLEFRYYFKRTSLSTIPGPEPDLFFYYRKTSIILGYRIF